jgi:hypothetical protein
MMKYLKEFETVDLGWIPRAKKCYAATQEQILFLEQSISRIRTQREVRYNEGSVQRALVDVELAYAESMLTMLRSLLDGKTVSQ